MSLKILPTISGRILPAVVNRHMVANRQPVSLH